MTRRPAGVLLVLAALTTTTLLPLSASPAAAANTTLRASTSSPLAGEQVRLSGTVDVARRVVYLQRYAGGHWRSIAHRRASSGGSYAFYVRAYETNYAYRTFSRALGYHGHRYASRLSTFRWVRPARPALGLTVDDSAVAQPQTLASTASGAARYAMAEGRFSPARPGRVVSVQAYRGGVWQTVGSARQSRTGVFQAPVALGYVGSASNPATLRASAVPVAGFRAAYSASVTPRYRTESFTDDFDGAALDATRWAPRLQPEQPGAPSETKRRACSSVPDDRNTSVGSGLLTLTISKRADAKAGCRYGRYYNSMIGTLGAGRVFSHGIFAARVKFNRHQGAHGAFWMQSPSAGGSEIDVAEYFGDGRRDGGLTAFVHYLGRRAGDFTQYAPIIGSGNTPADGFHIYSVEWTASGYLFRVDGRRVFQTDQPHVSEQPEEMILSMLGSDYEVPRLRGNLPSMQVDWVRAWQ